MSSYATSRVECINRIRTAYIMFRDTPIATITEEYSSLSGESDWVIRPIWENCDRLVQQGHIVDIGGIDMDLRKEEYVRRFTPYFVTQRTVSAKREDAREILDAISLDGYDRFEIMCRTHGVCGDDEYYVSRTPDIVVDVHAMKVPYDIPDFDTTLYGWL